MAIEILDYFECVDKNNWIEQIDVGDWEASRYLTKLLSDDSLRDLCGPSTKLLLLTENRELYSFCTLAEQDEINAPDMEPWIGFVYTFPDYRGKHYASTVINYACDIAKKRGDKEVYVSPSDDTVELYIKLGFLELDYPMTTIYGYETRVFSKKL